MLLNEVFEKFISYISYEENLSTHSVKAYKRDVFSLLEYLQNQNIIEAKDIVYPQVRAYISSLHDKLDKTSIARKISAIRSFLKYAISNAYIEPQVLNKIQRPKQAKKLSFALKENELNKLIDSAHNKNLIIESRNIAIVELLYASGLRVSELVNLKILDVNFEERIVKILGKGRKERIVPFNDEAKGALNEYLTLRPKLLKDDINTDKEFLFLNKGGTRLSTRSVQRLLKILSLNAGLLKHATPHTIRHSFATHILERGAGIKTVKELLGHASITATQRYTHLSMESLMSAYKKAHPKSKV